MKKVLIGLSLLGVLGMAQARDEAIMVPFQEAVDLGISSGKLDGSVKFYLSGAKTPKVIQKLGEDMSNKKTNGVGKSDQVACQWALLSALVAFQNSAKQRGANAVVDMHSFYKRNTVKNATQFQCGAGNIMAGVTMKGTYAKVR